MCDNQLERIIKVFCDVQHNKRSYSDSLKWLQDYHDEIGYDNFKDEFLHVLLLFQLHADFKSTNPYYDNVFEFWTRFLKRFDGKKKIELKEYLVRGFSEYLNHTNVILRFRVCESILAIFNMEAGFVEMLSVDLIEDLRSNMLERIKDINNSIKVKAIEIITFMQDIEDTEDPVIEVLISNLTNTYVKVRLAVVNAIAPVPSVIRALVNRILDVNENVRIATCKKFTNIPVQNLSIIQRHTLLRNGFKDFSEDVRKCVEHELLPWWLKCYNNNYMELMMALLLDGSDQNIKQTKQLSEKVLKTLFRNQSVVLMLEQLKLNDKLIMVEELTWSYAIYWRCVIQHLINEPEDQAYLEQVLPATTDFCDYLFRYYTSNNEKTMSIREYGIYQRILEELVHLAVLCDISDECSRLAHRQTLLQLLRGDISVDIVSTIFIYINKVMPDVNQRINFICEFVSDIRNSCESNVTAQDYSDYEEKTNNIRKEINRLLDEQKNAIKDLNLQMADKLKTDIEVLKTQLKELNDQMTKEEQSVKNNDPQTILKCVNIIIELLQSPDIVKLNNSLKTLHEELLKDLLFVNDAIIQSKIMQCYAILCSFKKDSAMACVNIFAPILISYRDKTSEVEECMLVIVINSLIDVILVWGEEAFPSTIADHNSSGTLEEMFSSVSFKEAVQIIVSMMEDKNDKVRETAGIAVTKLLDMDRIQSSLLLSRLILKWFNPITAEQDMTLYQYLGVFLVNFNLESHAGNQYVEAFTASVTAVMLAPASSPLVSVSMDKLIKFLTHVTSPSVTSNPELHMFLARLLALEISRDIDNIDCNIVYSKTLTMLDIYQADQEFINSMLDQCEDILCELEDGCNSASVKKHIQKCIYLLKDSSSVKLENESMSENEDGNN